MSSLPDVTFLYGRARALGSPTAGDPMNTVMIERGCFLGLATSAIEAYKRETNGFVLGNEGTRTIRARPRTITVLRAAYTLQTEDRKPNWVSHGNERAVRRARGAVENLDVGYRVLGGFHSHTGDDGDANLSPTDLDYVADELRRIGRTREPDGAAGLPHGDRRVRGPRPARRIARPVGRHGDGGGDARPPLVRVTYTRDCCTYAFRPIRWLRSSWTWAGRGTMSIVMLSSPVSMFSVPIRRILWRRLWFRSTFSSWV